METGKHSSPHHYKHWEMHSKLRLTKNSGFMYVHGRDKYFRPLIIFNPAHLKVLNFDADTLFNEVMRSCIVITEYVIKNCFIPGQIENWVSIMNVDWLSVWDLDRKLLKKLLTCLMDNYRCRNWRTYVVNTTTGIKMFYTIIKQFLKETTTRKFLLTDRNTHEEILSMVHPS